MFDYCIYNQLKKKAKAAKSFHMPGHKAAGEFKSKFKDASLDVTELSYTDNLLCPQGVIDRAQKDIAKILGATKSYITTDGSSSGVLALAYCASLRGDKLIVFRNSHQSVWNACKLFGIEPLIVQGAEKDGVLLPPDCESIEKLISNDPNIAGVLATSPDYYGNIAPLSKYKEITKKYNRLLLVDEAHGAHLAFGDSGYAGLYADMWVDGAHKTLSTLTQGAIISVNNTDLISALEEALSLFRTTSPSFPIMASVEYGVKFLANKPKILSDAKVAVAKFKAEATEGLGYTFYPSGDWTKLLLDFKPLGISPKLALQKLEKRGIYAELEDGRYILFYLSPQITEKDLQNLKKNLCTVIADRKLQKTYREKPEIPESERSYSFQYALKRQSEWIDLDDAVGRLCAKNAGFAPPCIPLVVTGELITAATVKALSQTKGTYGLKNGQICVVKKW